MFSRSKIKKKTHGFLCKWLSNAMRLMFDKSLFL